MKHQSESNRRAAAIGMPRPPAVALVLHSGEPLGAAALGAACTERRERGHHRIAACGARRCGARDARSPARREQRATHRGSRCVAEFAPPPLEKRSGARAACALKLPQLGRRVAVRTAAVPILVHEDARASRAAGDLNGLHARWVQRHRRVVAPQDAGKAGRRLRKRRFRTKVGVQACEREQARWASLRRGRKGGRERGGERAGGGWDQLDSR